MDVAVDELTKDHMLGLSTHERIKTLRLLLETPHSFACLHIAVDLLSPGRMKGTREAEKLCDKGKIKTENSG